MPPERKGGCLPDPKQKVTCPFPAINTHWHLRESLSPRKGESASLFVHRDAIWGGPLGCFLSNFGRANRLLHARYGSERRKNENLLWNED
ncbi:hypothetical protein CEXT_56801 [Caerostris extrusa]|uniref:Uncharacterized protein n=1 Tax=Caerostris extrusa TaxID=172846 RepID=A0AAV4TVE1_CAEEX|nr:hypothetical protein CEXT_56801 [Caerostris extrusa]